MTFSRAFATKKLSTGANEKKPLCPRSFDPVMLSTREGGREREREEGKNREREREEGKNREREREREREAAEQGLIPQTFFERGRPACYILHLFNTFYI